MLRVVGPVDPMATKKIPYYYDFTSYKWTLVLENIDF